MKTAVRYFAFCVLLSSFLNSPLRGQVPTNPDGPPIPIPIPPCKTVIVTVVRCDNRDPIGLFTASHKPNDVYVNNDLTTNAFVIYCGVPGYKFTVAASGFSDKEHTLTSQEVKDQFAEVCLDAVPKPCEECGLCPVKTVLTGIDKPDGAAKGVLHLYRNFRDLIAGTSLGRQLVMRYYEDAVQSTINNALIHDPKLAWDFLVLLVEVQPLINSLTHSKGLGRSCDGEPVLVLDEALAERLIAFGDKLNGATNGVIADELKQVNALIKQGIGNTAGELFIHLQSATVPGNGEVPKPVPKR